MSTKPNKIVPEERIRQFIVVIRSEKVILVSDQGGREFPRYAGLPVCSFYCGA